MISFRMLAITAAMATFCVTTYAETPVGAPHPDAPIAANTPMTMGDLNAQLARMDEQMKVMQAMHDRMMKTKTPEPRSALMAEHMKVMQDSMAMMAEMGPRSMMGQGNMSGNMGRMHDTKVRDTMDGDSGMHRQMMERRMQMMQSMMQMMLDRMAAAPGKSGGAA